MTVDDCYRELGVRPDASDAEIKAAWRKLAARWHPDRNPSPQALRKTQRINQALEEIRRARREQEDEAMAPAAEPAPTAGAEPVAVVDLDIVLTLDEVAAGGLRSLEGEIALDCQECGGSGRQPHPSDCPDCSGSGRSAQPMWFAWMAAGSACPTCEGRGSVHAACPACEARGHSLRAWQAQVTLPAGLRAGSRVDAAGTVTGSLGQVQLRLRIGIAPHALFTADADGTLQCSVPVDGFAWMGERWVEVPTAQGLQQMRLRRGSLKYRIKGAGLPWLPDGARADCLVAVTPLFPQELDSSQQAAIDRLVASNTGAADSEAGQRMRGWQAQVRRWQRGLHTGPAG